MIAPGVHPNQGDSSYASSYILIICGKMVFPHTSIDREVKIDINK